MKELVKSLEKIEALTLTELFEAKRRIEQLEKQRILLNDLILKLRSEGK